MVVSTYRLTDLLFGDDSWPDCRDSHELDRINQLSHYSLNAKNELGLVRGYGYDKCVRPITDPPSPNARLPYGRRQVAAGL